MDTKSTNQKSLRNRGFLSWLCFFLSVSILFAAATGFVIAVGSGNGMAEVKNLVELSTKDNLQEMPAFRRDISSLTYAALLELAESDGNQTLSKQYPNLKWESSNVLLFATDGHNSVSNTGSTDPKNQKNKRLLESYKKGAPEGYNYMLLFDGESITIERDGNRVYDTDTVLDTDGYHNALSVLTDRNDLLWESYEELYGLDWEDLSLILVVAPEPHTTEYSAVFSGAQEQLWKMRAVLVGAEALLGFSVIFFLIYLFTRRKKAMFDQAIARLTGKLWIEVKLIITFLLLLPLLDDFFYYNWYPSSAIYILILFWLFLLAVNDIRYNPGAFRHNSVQTIRRHLAAYQQRKPFEKRFLFRFWLFVAIEAVLLFFLVLALLEYAIGVSFVLILLALAVLGWYQHRMRGTINDFARLTRHISSIRTGKVYEPLFFHYESDLSTTAEELNTIQSGISRAVEDQVKAERMKVELITNVSHDIKTPLTSIINYIDLLHREKDLPEHVQDYVEILSGKADRLKKMVQDIFEISKASSGNIELHLEPLNLQKLIEQTLADMEENITAAGLAIKLDLPDEPVHIMADGNRMYRVFQNLFRNALQYSLEGSRIFIQLTVQDATAVTEIKNISRFPLDHLPDLTERFVRGDESRTTDGSGLGLSIAKSFTEACGGTFAIGTNADLFLATIRFPVLTVTEEPEAPVTEDTAEEAKIEQPMAEAIAEPAPSVLVTPPPAVEEPTAAPPELLAELAEEPPKGSPME